MYFICLEIILGQSSLLKAQLEKFLKPRNQLYVLEKNTLLVQHFSIIASAHQFTDC